jgi:SAM-dependent methyltransferase
MLKDSLVRLLMGLDNRLHLAGSTALQMPWVHNLSERIVEYPFVLRHLNLAKGGRVLDVGCGSSYFPPILASLGYQTYGIDIEDYPVEAPNFTFVKADVKRTGFPDGFFDRILVISTIEHIGIKHFEPSVRSAESADGGADRQAMQELVRILKPGGKILLTVPFGKNGRVIRNYQRFYTSSSLGMLLDGLAPETEEYYARKGLTWTRVPKEVASEIEEESVNYAVACIVALK